MTSPPPSPSGVPVLAGLSDIAASFDLLICDVWGVVHNGLEAFPGACDALSRFRAKGGTVVLVSNAPRPADRVAAMLSRLGAPAQAYDSIVTSGDLARIAVAERPGEPVCHIGPQRDHSLFERLDVRFAGPQDATYIVCTGFDDDETQTPEDYRPLLAQAAARQLPMICANPDLVVERGHKLIPCAGAIAVFYEQLGGPVIYAGKPHRPIYEETLRRAAQIRGAALADGRVLAIGDAIKTDIAGAASIGVPALFVARGIHAKELGLVEGRLTPERLSQWAAAQNPRPSAVIETLFW